MRTVQGLFCTCTTTVAVSTDMRLRAPAQLVSKSIHTWIDIHAWHIYFYIPLSYGWGVRREFSFLQGSRLNTPSARYVFTHQKALVKTAHSINTLLYLCLFVTLPPTSYLHYSSTHVLPYLEWKSVGIGHAPRPISDFLAIFLSSQTASANVHKPRYHWSTYRELSKWKEQSSKAAGPVECATWFLYIGRRLADARSMSRAVVKLLITFKRPRSTVTQTSR